MAAPAAVAVQILASLMPNDPKDIIKWLLIIIMLPLALLVLLFAGPVVMHERVPLASPSQVELYVDAAGAINEEYGFDVNWQHLLAIDAVRLKQDFSRTSAARAVNLAEMFVEEITKTRTVTDPETGEITTETYTVYEQKSLSEVLNDLGFTRAQKHKVYEFLEIDLTFLRDVGTGVPPGWMPVEGRFLWPVPGEYRVTSGFGSRVDPVEGIDGFHYGLDVGCAMGTPVVAAADGEVVFAGKAGNYGNLVKIDHGNGYETRYAHLWRIKVRYGQKVKAGKVIGYVGSTGKSTGPHLHFEIRLGGRPVNPVDFY
ncbi:MAG: M23 family metallopeptidase [Peptococcaceae bacterium]|nr:M23 family metallopeptidase [Peptococcaceae bacterium]